MSVVLTAYSTGAFREFYLPMAVDDEYEIAIDQELFHLTESISIHFEAVNSQWFVISSGHVATVNGVAFSRHLLKEGDLVIFENAKDATRVALIVSESADSARSFEKFALSSQDITIGSDGSNTIQYQYHNLISANHARFIHRNDAYILQDASRNGTFVGNRRIKGEYTLAFGDVVNIFDLRIVYLGTCLAIDTKAKDVSIKPILKTADVAEVSASADSKHRKRKEYYFKRSPRIIGKLYEEPIEIEAPPQPQQRREQPLLLTIGPAFTMVIPMLAGTMVSALSRNGAFNAVGIVVAGLSGCFAVIWALFRVRNAKKTAKEDEEHRESEYIIYLDRNIEELKKQTSFNAQVLHERYPAAAECASFAEQKHRLWNRNTSHADFLYTRLGIGTVPFQAPIIVPKERFSLINDALAERPREIKEQYEYLHDVPIGIDLKEKSLVGLFGANAKTRVTDVARNLVVQVAANNCYTDVKLVFLLDEHDAEDWDFVRWLPHVWDESGKVRFFATNKVEQGDIAYYLSSIFRDRAEYMESHANTPVEFRPHYIIFVSRPSLLEGEPIAKYLLNSPGSIGVTTIIFSESYEDLPNNCVDLIQCDNQFSGMYDVSTMMEERNAIQFDSITPEEAERFFRELSKLRVRETESGREIPNSLTFLDMYNVTALSQLSIEERWRKNRTYESMRALIGQKGGGADVYLDIHEKLHGPHGLVAGTTGSGKSETLQTFILSLAINFSPLDVGFLIIDFKGGGMANLFSSLPHMIGQITNLSGNQVRRAMVSIKSEIKRRQRIFGEYDVNHIDMYTRLYKNKEAVVPIPHLLIIIDEFAELKREEPDFMRELISVAQVGRSLGVHLILATQKPAGVVDDNIWSNSKFRLCLRVQDKQDSNDMLKKPDAAYITQAGRCYMQVGNDEIFELFQSGWSGAAFDDDQQDLHAQTASLLSRTGKMLEGKKRKVEMKEARRIRWISLLVTLIKTTYMELSYDIRQATDDADVSPLVSGVFSQLAKMDIDYQKNSSNIHRIEDLYRLYRSVEKTDKSETDIACEIIAKAGNTIRLPEMKERTQLTAIVEYIEKLAAKSNLELGLNLWLPLLPEQLYLEQLAGYAGSVFDGKTWPKRNKVWKLEAPVGLCDDPVNQSQFPISVNFAADGHLALCGMAMSGKSTFMQTLVYSLCMKYDPNSLNIYILDFSNKMLLTFARAPQVGGVVTEDEPERLSKFFVMIAAELAQRKRILSGGSYAQHVRAKGIEKPAILCVIDGYANFREKTDNAFEGDLITLAREGATYGIFLCLSSGGFGAAEIQNRIGDNIKTVISLEMGDKFKYTDVMRTMHLDILPERVKGRGLTMQNGAALEFQTALAVEAADDYARAERIAQTLDLMRDAFDGRSARSIPSIPESPTYEQFMQHSDYDAASKQQSELPIGYVEKDASLYSISLNNVFTYLIAGKIRTGKSIALRVLMKAAKEKQGKILIVDSSSHMQRETAETVGGSYYVTDSDYAVLGNVIMQEMIARNGYKNQLVDEKIPSEEIFQYMRKKYPPLFIFIDDLAEFVQRIYTKKAGIQDISGFMENFIERGEQHNVYVFCALSTENYGKVVGRRVFDLIASRKKGMYLGGNVTEQKFFSFTTMNYKEQLKVYKPGVALIPAAPDAEPTMVILPMVKG